MTKRTPISFEFFPPKTDAGAEKLRIVHQELQQLNPEFFSITYGAGGSTRERTLAAIEDFNGKGTPVAPHLSCIGDDKTHSIYTKLKALTVLSLYVVTYHLDRLVLANFLMLKI